MNLTLNTAQLIEFTRIYLAAFFTFVAIFYTTKIIFTQKKSANSLVFAGARFSSTWWNHMLFRLFRASIWLLCVCRLFMPQVDDFLGYIHILQTPVVILSGNILLTLGFIWTLTVHLSVGQSWRSGIDPKGPKLLNTTGFYSQSRNPMFLGIAIAQLGFFMALPSVFTLICLILGLVALHRQTMSEEKHLTKIFAQQYLTYKTQVGRWW